MERDLSLHTGPQPAERPKGSNLHFFVDVAQSKAMQEKKQRCNGELNVIII